MATVVYNGVYFLFGELRHRCTQLISRDVARVTGVDMKKRVSYLALVLGHEKTTHDYSLANEHKIRWFFVVLKSSCYL